MIESGRSADATGGLDQGSIRLGPDRSAAQMHVITEAFRRAEHDLALEGSSLKALDIPECQEMIEGRMDADAAVASMVARFRKA